MKFRIGDEVEAITEYYLWTCKSDKWRGRIVEIDDNGTLTCVTTYSDYCSCIEKKFRKLPPNHFQLYKKSLALFKRFLKSLGGSDV